MHRCSQLIDFQSKIAFGTILAFVVLRQIATDHESNHGFMVHLFTPKFARIFTIPQNSDVIRKLLDLTQSVGNVNHADTPVPQVLDHDEKILRLCLRQTRGRFVHDQNTGIDRQGFGNLNHLLPAYSQISNQSIRVNVETHHL